jgi:hypothetical protein
LQEEVLQAVRTMFRKRADTLNESFDCTYGDTMYDKAFGRWEEHANKLPEGWLHKKDDFLFIGTVCTRTGEDSVNIAPNRIFYLSTPRVYPGVNMVIASGGKLRKDGWGREMTYVCDLSDPQDAAFYQQVSEWREKCIAIDRQCKEFKQSVEKIMTSFTTLAPALKAWPPLWDLLPEWAKLRHKEVVERKKRDPAEDLGVDLNKMTSVVTINKLTGGS